jgi:hypothetical protein
MPALPYCSSVQLSVRADLAEREAGCAAEISIVTLI